MGVLFSKRKSVTYKVFIFGLDCSGKTTTLYMLRNGKVATTIPTIGYNAETFVFENVNVAMWDVGGRGKLRRMAYNTQSHGHNGYILAIDSTDRLRIKEARNDLHSLVTSVPEVASMPLLILANKQDVENAMTTNEIRQLLELDAFNYRDIEQQDKQTKTAVLPAHVAPIRIQPSCAISGEGLNEGMSWLTTQMKIWRHEN